MLSDLIKKITNLYLYGTEGTPMILADDQLIRKPNADIPINERVAAEFEVNKYMETGAGRFAKGPQFQLIELFFGATNQLAPNTAQKPFYTKAEVANHFNLTYYGLPISQEDFRDSTDDYLERAYVWHSTAFKIVDEAEFVVLANGQVRIDKYGIIPDDEVNENFDFDGEGFAAWVYNSIAEPRIDPSLIGRTINLEFTGTRTLINNYDSTRYQADETTISGWQGSNLTKLVTEGLQLLEDLWDEGITKFLDEEDRAIIYGTISDDSLNATDAQNMPTLSSYWLDGATLIGGDGYDDLSGSVGDDRLLGGDDDDTLIGNGGNDIYDGGADYDTIEYNGALFGFIGDTVNITEKATSPTAAGNGDTITNIERIDGSSGVDRFNIEIIQDTSLKLLEMGDGDDEVRMTGPGVAPGALEIRLGDGDDYLEAAPDGAVVYGGAGDDIFTPGQGYLIADPEEGDRVSYFGKVLTGGIRYKGSESPWAKGRNGDFYGLNGDGELVISDKLNNKTFVNDFDERALLNNNQEAMLGINLGEIEFNSYRLFDTPNGWQLYETFQAVMGYALKAMTGRSYFASVDPLVLDLDGDGIELTARTSVAPFFDIDADQFSEQVGWVSGDDGFLAVDINGNGVIDNIDELVGGPTISGFAALAPFDDNSDGKIDADDVLYDYLRVWKDANSDAVTDPGELLDMESAGVEAIYLTPHTTTEVRVAGNTITAQGYFKRSGSDDNADAAEDELGTVADVNFQANQRDTIWLGDDTVSSAAAALPEIKGHGTLNNLRIAMTDSQALLNAVQAAVPSLATLDFAVMRGALNGVMTEWMAAVPVPAGTPGLTPRSDVPVLTDITAAGAQVYDFAYQTTDSQGTYWKLASGNDVLDAQSQVIPRPTMAEVLAQSASQGSWLAMSGLQIQFMERFGGTTMPFGVENFEGTESIAAAQTVIEFIWDGLNKIALKMAAQGPLEPFFAGIEYNVETDRFEATTDRQIAPMLEAIFTFAPSSATAAAAYLEDWNPVLNLFLDEFVRGEAYLEKTYAFMFQNIVAAYENVPIAVTLVQAAESLDIPADLIQQGSGTVVGSNDADLFYLGAGNQILQGGDGPDSYIVGRNFGQDVIDDVEAALEGKPDTLRFAHLQSTDVGVARDGMDLVISDNGSTDELRVKDQFVGYRYAFNFSNIDPDHGIREIVWANGEVWDLLDIAKAVSTNTTGNDTIIGTRTVDFLDGGLGDDRLEGKGEGDVYRFGIGDGHDTIFDEIGYVAVDAPDLLQFKQGIAYGDLRFERDGRSNDVTINIEGTQDQVTIEGQFTATYPSIFGGDVLWMNRIEGLVLDDGYTLSWNRLMENMVRDAKTSGDDDIYGFSWEDVLDGGAGDDFLSGGNENDIYRFGLGYGNDHILEHRTNILSGGFDVLKFGAGITFEDVNFSRDGGSNHVTFTLQDGSTMFIENQFDLIYTGTFGLQEFNRIEQFEFEDQSFWTSEDLKQMLLQQNLTSGNDVAYGYKHSAETLDGGAGDDALHGLSGDDVLIGGLGNDELYGGDGEDNYFYSSGDGDDQIFEGGLHGAQDRLKFTDINSSEIILQRNVNSLDDATLLLSGYAGSVFLADQFSNHQVKGIETIEFANGEEWTNVNLQSLYLSGVQTAGNDIIHGFSNSDDVINGGLGDDEMHGRSGDDTYIYSSGDGNDQILEGGNWGILDRLKFTDINASEIIIQRDPSSTHDATLSFVGQSGSIFIDELFHNSSYYGIEEIEFADNTVWAKENMQNAYLSSAQTSGNDVIYGFSHYDDTIDGGLGNDEIYGFTGDDELFGGAGDDIIDGGNHHDILFGGDGDDILHGAAGNDILIGGLGADVLDGSIGADTYRFTSLLDSQNIAQDTITYFSSVDLIDVTGLGFTGLEAGQNPTAGKLGTYQQNGDTFVTDGNNFTFAIDQTVTLTESDFIFS